MRMETRTAVLLMALVLVGAVFAIPTTMAHPGKKVVSATEGAGKINSSMGAPNISHFNFEAKNMSGMVKGKIHYTDPAGGIKQLKGNVTMLTVNKTLGTADFSGMAELTNSTGAKMMVSYTAHVMKGKKGVGTFNISIPSIPYSDTGTLLAGKIKVDP